VVGFCAEGTLGRLIRDGAKEVRIFGEQKKVLADLRIMDSFSAHGDHQEMLNFLNGMDRNKLKKIFLVHGELDRQEAFKESLLDMGFKKVEIPVLDQIYNLAE
jgi:metallo-beta-lactamase family protein